MEQNFELSERKVDIQDKRIADIIIYQLDAIKGHYDENLELITKQFPIAEQLKQEGNVEAAETIWRTQIVLLSSAFDFFMHEIVWYGLDKIYDGDWPQTEQYKNLSIRLETLQTIMEDLDSKTWFADYITEKYKTQTIMIFGDVRDHLNLIGVSVDNVAKEAFYQQGCSVKPKDQMKQKLDGLYSRRNRIAHQTDRSERDAERQAISDGQVITFIEDVNKIVVAIMGEKRKRLLQ
ncbi:MAG: hypothetical protein J6A94_11885 [Lachnospiraceae bacterium]|nr:hypothetical protein [Lachnospiraceae bacterium]